jgi:hypothetical protein
MNAGLSSDFDDQMSGINFWEGDENLRYDCKTTPFYEMLSGCLHFGIFCSQKVHTDFVNSAHKNSFAL